MGSILIGLGSIGGIAVWLLTCLAFFGNGDTFLGLIALLVPPADLILPFLISPQLGFLGIGSVVVFWMGMALKKNA